MNISDFLSRTVLRTRSIPDDEPAGSCAGTSCGPTALPSAAALRSTRSLPGRPGSLVGFIATMAGSDFSFPLIPGFGYMAFPAGAGGALHLRSVARYPGSRTRGVPTCRGLRPRWTGAPHAITRRPVLPSGNPSTAGICFFRSSMVSLHDLLPTPESLNCRFWIGFTTA